MLFYEILLGIMNEKSLSIPEVARLSGLSDSTVRSIISRKARSVSLDVAFRLSDGLGVSLEHLNGDSSYPIIFKVSSHEQKVVESYRAQPAMQPAVDKLLGVENAEKSEDKAIG